MRGGKTCARTRHECVNERDSPRRVVTDRHGGRRANVRLESACRALATHRRCCEGSYGPAGRAALATDTSVMTAGRLRSFTRGKTVQHKRGERLSPETTRAIIAPAANATASSMRSAVVEVGETNELASDAMLPMTSTTGNTNGLRQQDSSDTPHGNLAYTASVVRQRYPPRSPGPRANIGIAPMSNYRCCSERIHSVDRPRQRHSKPATPGLRPVSQ